MAASMPGNKARLYIALFVRGGAPKMPGKEDKYHWALVVGPKKETSETTGIQYHAKNALGQSTWVFEEKEIPLTAANMILVRVLIGKVKNPSALIAQLRRISVDNNNSSNSKINFNCVRWVQTALESISNETAVMGTSVLDWETVRTSTMQFVGQKVGQGRFKAEGNVDRSKVPTFDLLQGRETVR